MKKVKSIEKYINGFSPKNWSIDYFFENENNVLFTKIPKTPSIEIHSNIVNYISNVREQNLKPYYVAKANDVKVHCFNQVGSVSLTHNDYIFEDVSTKYDFPNFTSEKNEHIDSKSVLLSIDSGSNYFHWMCHVLPRIKLVQEYGIDWSEINKIILPENRGDFVDQTLGILGIPVHKIIETDKNTTYTFDSLIIPCKPNRHIHLAPWSIDFLRDTFLKEHQKQEKKIFISRRSDTGRCIENEDELWSILSQQGYERVYLEDYSVYEQAILFNSSKEIVSPHGAGLTNLVFCQPNTKLIELFNPSYFLALYWNMCNILDLDYYYIIGDGDNLGKEKGKNQNIKINIEEFKRII